MKIFNKEVISKSKRLGIVFFAIVFSVFFVFLSCLNSGCSSQKITEGSEPGRDGGYKNDFTLLDLDENEVSLSEFKGKIIVLNFWATWCPPCRAEIPSFINVYNQYQDRDVQFIGVSLDEDIEYLSQFVKEFGINYPVLIDGSLDNVSGKWGISAIPTTFILDRNGEILFKNVGMMSESHLIEAIEQFL